MAVGRTNAAAKGGGSNTGVCCWGRYEGQPELPVGYTRLSYIESSGAQYIDTKIVPNANTKICGDVWYTTSNTGQLYGTWTSYMTNAFGMAYQVGKNSVYYGGNEYEFASPNKKFSFVHNGPLFYLNGILKHDFGTGKINTTRTIYLFAFNVNGAPGTLSVLKVYSGFEIYQDGQTLSRRFIACRDTKNKTCLYDTVSNQPFYNSGSGSFKAGEVEQDNGKKLIGYVVSDDPNAYPNGGVAADGYYYEMVGDPAEAAIMETALNELGVSTRE